MRQKNLIAVAVALGFGLCAMYLATRIHGGGTPPPPEEVDVLVAAQDIPANTKLSADMLPPLSDAWVTTKKWPKSHVPSAFVGTVADLKDKKIVRSTPKDGIFHPKDVSFQGTIDIADGMNMMTIPIGREALLSGFAVPGNKVDLIATFQLRRTQGPTVFPLLKNLKILAVDMTTVNTNPGTSIPAFSNVSFEVTKKQALILDLVNGRGVRLNAILPSSKSDDYPPSVPKGEDEVWTMLEREFNPPPPTLPSPTSVKVLIANTDLPAGTKLTPELLAHTDRLVGMIELALPRPEGTIEDPMKHVGKVLTKAVGKGQLVFDTMIGETISAPPLLDEIPQIHDITLQTASGTKTFRFHGWKKGSWTFVGPAPVTIGTAPRK